jgi:exonuclease III
VTGSNRRPLRCKTYKTDRSPVPWQNDYLFASEALADRLVRCQVIGTGEQEMWRLSDHLPVIAEFEL